MILDLVDREIEGGRDGLNSIFRTEFLQIYNGHLLHDGLRFEMAEAQLLQILSRSMVHIGVTDLNGRSAVHLAAIAGLSADLLKAILQKGGDVNLKDTLGGSTPMHLLQRKDLVSFRDSLSLLVEAGADVNALDMSGVSLLMGLARDGFCKLLGCLLVTVPACDVQLGNHLGWTVLHSVSDGVQTNEDEDGRIWTVDALCAAKGQILRTLVQGHGVDVNCTTIDGRTVLHLVASMDEKYPGLPDYLWDLLLELGAAENLQDSHGRTALDIRQAMKAKVARGDDATN